MKRILILTDVAKWRILRGSLRTSWFPALLLICLGSFCNVPKLEPLSASASVFFKLWISRILASAYSRTLIPAYKMKFKNSKLNKIKKIMSNTLVCTNIYTSVTKLAIANWFVSQTRPSQRHGQELQKLFPKENSTRGIKHSCKTCKNFVIKC